MVKYQTLTLKDLRDFVNNSTLPDDTDLMISYFDGKDTVTTTPRVVGISESYNPFEHEYYLIFDSRQTIVEAFNSLESQGKGWVREVFCKSEKEEAEETTKTGEGTVVWYNPKKRLGRLDDSHEGQSYIFSAKSIITVDQMVEEGDKINYTLDLEEGKVVSVALKL